jgi:hypothetical protein
VKTAHWKRQVAAGLVGIVMATAGLAQERGTIPEDLLDDEHVREELAVNAFTAPSISKIFSQLDALSPLPVADVEREMPARMPLDRADLAVELGFLIADGFLIVQSGELGKVESLAKDLSRYGKALGAGDRVNRHSAALLESAKKGEVEELKKELAATQKDVEADLLELRDADLAHLISLGGWVRALEVASTAVNKDFTPKRAKQLIRPDVADYYEYSVGTLEPRISERPSFIQLREVLLRLRKHMTLPEDKEPTPEMVAAIRKDSAELVKLALTRAGNG